MAPSAPPDPATRATVDSVGYGRAEERRPRPDRVIVLAMHGVPPADFPRRELSELMGLHARPAADPARLGELDRRVRRWPRSPENDPYWSGSWRLAQALAEESVCQVIVGFNGFCDPTVEDAIRQAASLDTREVLVMTPMLTRGGSHAEVEIPEAIARARLACPDVPIRYVWPVEVGTVARFLSRLARLWSEVA